MKAPSLLEGIIACHNGEFDKAEHIFSSMISLDPKNAGAYNMRGMTYAQQGLLDKAFADYNRAIEMAYLERSSNEAKDDFSKKIKNSWYASMLHSRGNLYYDQGLFDEAANDYSRAIEISPWYNTDALNSRGSIYLEQGLFDQAAEDFNRLVLLSYPEEKTGDMVKIFNHANMREGVLYAAALITAGFYIDIRGNPQNVVIMPFRNMRERSVLFFDKLHTGKTITRHIRQLGERYALRFDVEFDAIFTRCVERHGESLLTPAFRHCLKAMREDGALPRPVSFALYKDDRLVAGDIGIQTGKIYTSYSGYYEKDEPSSGMAQLILMARYLEKNGFAFLDFGPGNSQYKSRLGAVGMTHSEFKKLFFYSETQQEKKTWH